MDIQGAYLFAGWGFSPESDFAEVYLPRDPKLGRMILEGCEKTVLMAEKGLIPTNDNVSDPDLLKRANEAIYGSISPTLPAKELKGKNAEKMLEALSAINEELKSDRASLKKLRENNVSDDEKKVQEHQKALEAEKQRIIDKLLDASKDNDGAFLKGKNGDYVVNVSRDISVDKSMKDYIRENYPDVYQELAKMAPKLNVGLKKRAK